MNQTRKSDRILSRAGQSTITGVKPKTKSANNKEIKQNSIPIKKPSKPASTSTFSNKKMSIIQTSFKKNPSSIFLEDPPTIKSSLTSTAILDGLKEETALLSPELSSLAQAIVKAVIAATDAKIEEERRRHEEEEARLKKIIQKIADRNEHLESYGRRNSFVISGSAIPKSATNEDCYDVAMSLISNQTGINISRSDIDVCHRLPIRSAEDDRKKKPIIVKMVRREIKHRILQAARIKKPSNIYFNDSLTKTRSKIRYVLSKAKKDYPGKIASIKTDDGRVKVFTPPLQTGGPYNRTEISTKKQLDDFLVTKFGFSSAKYVKEDDWDLEDLQL